MTKKKKKNLLDNKIIYNLACRIGFAVTDFLCKKVKYHEFNKDKVEHLFNIGSMFFIWHRTLMIPIYANKFKGVTTLAANSPDGGIQAYICERFGYTVHRGSTNRGGVKGLLYLMNTLFDNRPVALTVDGPIGPPEKCQPGASLMIKKTKMPFTAIGVAIDKAWIMKKSWDGFQIPKPGSNAFIYYSDPIYLDYDKSSDEILSKVEKAIKEASRKAEELLEESQNG